MKNKNQTGLKNFKPNIKLNHNTYKNKSEEIKNFQLYVRYFCLEQKNNQRLFNT